MIGKLLFVAVLCVFVRSDDGVQKSYSVYETPDKIRADGFPVEIHHVTTSDGYILEMHRIPYGRTDRGPEDKPVVFLMHGLLSASISYIYLGPDYAPAYNLADAGFDVWMGNARGNKNSRHHVSLDPDDEEEKYQFFDFSFEEIGMYDLPAMIDYALEYTGKDKLHYIGHSQGGTVFLVMGSMVPEYNQKLVSVHLLAGVGYQQYFPNEDIAQIAGMTDFIYGFAVQNGVVELFPPNSTDMFPPDLLPQRRSDNCVGDPEKNYMCELFGVRHILRDDSQFSEVIDRPGAALKQVAHYGQNVRDKNFRRYNFGIIENLFKYGRLSPPSYDLSLITTRVTMHYTVNDNLLDERDVLDMVADMPNAVARKVARTTFLHEDFVAALDAKELVTDFIIDALVIESLEDSLSIENPDKEETDIIDAPPDVIDAPSDAIDAPSDAIDAPSDVTEDASDIVDVPSDVIDSPLDIIDATQVTDAACTFGAVFHVYLAVISLYVILK